ncbi:MAG TPA: aldo/keto reductase [Solirubrobacterales bacterium]|jgi:aryl-alcohol dehydrogenase-like predicted oxidoreductase
MEQRALGSQGLIASAQGLGCMGMSQVYGEPDDAESIATIHRALELGVTLLDTAEVYGPYENEMLVGRAIADRRDQAVIATKFGISGVDPDTAELELDGRPETARRSCEGSIERLGLDHIDLYYLHRVDPKVPIEETIGAMGELVDEGKVRALGISEAAPETIRRAHATRPISAVQTEYSLWSRDPERNGVIETCRELGIAFVAYSPLGRGFLTGQVRSLDQLAEDDFRRVVPRFQGDNLEANIAIVERLDRMAEQKGVSAAQLALAWVHARGEDVFPIPGTKRRRCLEENAAAFDVELGRDIDELERAAGEVAGDRYQEPALASVDA